MAVMASLIVLRFATTPDPETGAPVAEALTDAGANPSSGESEVPVRLVGADDLRGLSLDVQRSRLHVYDAAFSYTLYAGPSISPRISRSP